MIMLNNCTSTVGCDLIQVIPRLKNFQESDIDCVSVEAKNIKLTTSMIFWCVPLNIEMISSPFAFWHTIEKTTESYNFIRNPFFTQKEYLSASTDSFQAILSSASEQIRSSFVIAIPTQLIFLIESLYNSTCGYFSKIIFHPQN